MNSPLVKQVFTGGSAAREIVDLAVQALGDRMNKDYYLRDIQAKAMKLANELDAHAKSLGLAVK